jgi:hypothetical protein
VACIRVLRWTGQEWIERVVAYVVGLPFHHTIVYERTNTTWNDTWDE